MYINSALLEYILLIASTGRGNDLKVPGFFIAAVLKTCKSIFIDHPLF